MFKRLTTYATFAATLLVTLTSVGSAQTQMRMQAPPADCAHADAQLHAMVMPVTAPSGTLDTDVAHFMAVQEKMMMAAAKLEMRCGTDPAMKHHAAVVVEDAPRILFSGGTPH